MDNFIDPEELIDKDIFSLLGIQDASDAKKKEMNDNMIITVQNRVLARILDSLDDAALREYETILDSGDDKKANEFLLAHNIDLTKITTEEALLYKTEIVNLIKSQKKPA